MRRNKKNMIYVISLLGVLLLVFNVLVLSINRSYKANFWTGYLFTTFAYVLACIICIAPIGIKTQRNNGVFYSLPRVLFSGLYMILQLLVGCCVIFIENFTLTVAVLLQVLLLLIYLSFMIILMFYRNNTEQNLYGEKARRFLKREIEVKINSLEDVSEGKCKTALEKLKEQIRYDVENFSTEQAGDVENKIIVKLEELEESLMEAEEEKVTQLCKEISYLLRQRNELCKNRM